MSPTSDDPAPGPGAEIPRASASLVVPGRMGIHARPAARIVEIARRYAAEVVLGHGEVRASAKELLDVLYLAAPAGSVVEVTARGHDAAAAVDALLAFLASLGDDA